MNRWVTDLLEWYKKVKRPLPWRQTQDAYRVWISEIMLQQTRIEAVLGYYERFMNAFPSVQALAEAPLEQVLKLWEGLGYYSRAKNLHKAAQQIVMQGGFPDQKEEIQKLPGIGDYTAGAIAAIAFGRAETAIDGNVMRVVSRIYELENDILLPASRKQVKAILEDVYPQSEAGNFVQGLMELGELICIPKAPKCEACPLQSECRAKETGRQQELPLRIPKTKKKMEERIVLIVEQKGCILLTKRPEKMLLGGLWEYPNVLTEDPAMVPELTQEAYGIRLEAQEHIAEAEHVFTHVRWKMHVYKAQPAQAGGQDDESCFAAARREYLWADEKQLETEIMLPTAFKKIIW
ncbi:MAG: A/G-specific adenine glycosylase [Lachnospiraceae bacterium]|jgi:A/G-specific adenine glycosylase|nr:A/G-specific adenine glycosylase [Lachnospiraceae bacterium]